MVHIILKLRKGLKEIKEKEVINMMRGKQMRYDLRKEKEMRKVMEQEVINMMMGKQMR